MLTLFLKNSSLLVLELRTIATETVEAEWAIMTLCKIGFPFIQLLETYESHLQDADRNYVGGADAHQVLEYLSSLIKLVEYWVVSAKSQARANQRNVARQQLSREVSSGNLMRKIDMLKGRLETMPGQEPYTLRDRLLVIEEQIRDVI